MSLTKKLLVHVSPEMHTALKTCSRECEQPVSAIVRRALDMYLDPRGGYAKFPVKAPAVDMERPREY